jgi:predicted metal-binding membrane protein
MMVAMMIPATLPLILLYHHLARKRLRPAQARISTAILLVGYVVVWASAGLPVFVYNAFSSAAGSLAAVLPALLLIVGGVYQFTPLKRICHARCSSPLFFLIQNWRALRSEAGSDPRRRLLGLLRRADGGLGGTGDDELDLDAHRRGHYLRGEDDPR